MDKKRITMLTMSAVLLVMMLFIAACGKNDTGNQSNVGNETNQSDTGKETDKDKEADTGKKVITDRSFSFSMPYHATYMSKTPDINDNDPYVTKLEELTGTKIEYRVLQNPFTSNMDLMFASNDFPNLVATSGGFGSKNGIALKQALDAGKFMPLDDLIDEYGPLLKEFIPKAAWDTETYNGKIYGIPQFLSVPHRSSTFIRMDLLEQTGLPIPETVDDMLDVLRAFKEMGVEQPYVGREEFSQMDVFFGAFDVIAHQWTIDTNGNPVPKFFDVENMQKALQTYNTLYKEGLMTREFLTQTKVQYQNIINTGKAGMFQANANNFIPLQTGLEKSIPGAKYALIAAPTGTDGSGGYAFADDVTRAFMITAETKNPEAIIEFLNWSLTDEAAEFFTYGLEGIDHTVENGVIKYAPTTDEQIRAESFRGWLWPVRDVTNDPLLMEASPYGEQLFKDFDNIVSKEGREGIRFNPPLASLDAKPTLNLNSGIPPFILENISKMVVGEKPISDWANVVEQWKKQGGDEALAEAAEKYKNGEYETIRLDLKPIPVFGK